LGPTVPGLAGCDVFRCSLSFLGSVSVVESLDACTCVLWCYRFFLSFLGSTMNLLFALTWAGVVVLFVVFVCVLFSAWVSVGVLVCFCSSFVVFDRLCDFVLVGILLTTDFRSFYSNFLGHFGSLMLLFVPSVGCSFRRSKCQARRGKFPFPARAIFDNSCSGCFWQFLSKPRQREESHSRDRKHHFCFWFLAPKLNNKRRGKNYRKQTLFLFVTIWLHFLLIWSRSSRWSSGTHTAFILITPQSPRNQISLCMSWAEHSFCSYVWVLFWWPRGCYRSH